MTKSEKHPLEPFFPAEARLLMLGSFPPEKKRWCMDFFYPNFQNDMWRIFGTVFYADKDKFVNKTEKSFDKFAIIQFLKEKGIALYDVAESAKRLKGNASDKFLEVSKPIDLESTLHVLPSCAAIAATGGKAADTLSHLFDISPPLQGEYEEVCVFGRRILFFRMPSSSRAYPMSLEKKSYAYSAMFSRLKML